MRSLNTAVSRSTNAYVAPVRRSGRCFHRACPSCPCWLRRALFAPFAPAAADRLDKPVRILSAVFLILIVAATIIKERAIIARKGAEYASRMYGWQLGGANFKLVLKSELRSI